MNEPETHLPGTLYLVATPIGNLDDMTFRAVRVLQTADLIAAEDTRRTGKLLQHFAIATPQTSYHEHNRRQRAAELVDRLLAGANIALVTDAGMPGISDPGSELAAACAAAGIPVVPVPGATAAIAAIAASGLPAGRFAFEGFLPTKHKDRQARLQSLATEPRTIALYEAPHRLLTTLQDLAAALGGDRAVVLARELTKLHEEFAHLTLGEAIACYQTRQPKGEFVLVLAGATCDRQIDLTPDALRAELQDALERGLTRSQACRELANLTGLPRRDLYQLALDLDGSVPDAGKADGDRSSR
ncbi:16S rRNA (cytidine(1402)-2'-O)-methyltransferase [Rubidibacter lacunae]|nr:16S rRNA (cytidine(1402)-2'-O)-methyltransferase [Rubidibacter lacunae]